MTITRPAVTPALRTSNRSPDVGWPWPAAQAA